MQLTLREDEIVSIVEKHLQDRGFEILSSAKVEIHRDDTGDLIIFEEISFEVK